MGLYRNGKQPREIYRNGNQIKQIYRNGKLVWYRYFPTGYQLKIGTSYTGLTQYGEIYPNEANIGTGWADSSGVRVDLKDDVADKLPPNGAVKIVYYTSRYSNNPTSIDDTSAYYAKQTIPISFIKSSKSEKLISITWYLEDSYKNYFSTEYLDKDIPYSSSYNPQAKYANNFEFSFAKNKDPNAYDTMGTYDYVVLTIV